jgi:hypothetical protein
MSQVVAFLSMDVIGNGIAFSSRDTIVPLVLGLLTDGTSAPPPRL